MKIRILAAALGAVATGAFGADERTADNQIETVVVTAVRMQKPLVVETDPHIPRQPLPAHDGAEYLKTIPGFNVIRKGGTDGDPLFRGMAASRVNILMDGEALLGGCGMRMDPPTAYVFPEAYDRITVIKGPQTVLHGPGNAAATVLFERDTKPLARAGWEAQASATGAAFGRDDEVLRVRGGSPRVYAELSGTHAESDDYEDGNGDRVHSEYERHSVNAAIGWTPGADTLLELSGALSDGEAAYADRSMDGAEFERENLGLRYRKTDVSEHLLAVEAQAFYNYIDHVMDNYSLRDFAPSMMMPFPSAMNPDRETTGARIAVELALGERTRATLGLDQQANQHAGRSTMNQTMMPYEDMDRVDDARFAQIGLFAEATHHLDADSRLIAGLRVDDWEAKDQRDTIRLGMMGMQMTNPTAGERRGDTLESGFARWEHDLASGPTVYAGVGHVERFPDYWELFSDKESTTTISAFDTRPEKNTQLDTGLVWNAGAVSVSASLFWNDIEDYILIESKVPKGMRSTVVTRNVDATTLGGELGVGWAITPQWTLDATLAYTRGENDTDGGALAQQPPLEGRLGLSWARGPWSLGGLLRVVDDQDRVAINQGNVVGQDLGETDGFTVLSLNGGWKIDARWQLTAGVDNLLDETYAEHLSRGGAMLAGYTQTDRVNEPGRLAWMRLAFSL
jgi:iron complex outermembrane receptor protein